MVVVAVGADDVVLEIPSWVERLVVVIADGVVFDVFAEMDVAVCENMFSI